MSDDSTPSTNIPKRDWKTIVEGSKGAMFFAPTALEGKLKEWQEKRSAFSKEANRLAKIEAEIGVMFTQIIHDLRAHFSDNGIPEVWTMDIGFNTEALKEGQFILNITKGERQV